MEGLLELRTHIAALRPSRLAGCCIMSSLKANITIAIVGGGLGGLCAAIALGRAGYAGMCSRLAQSPLG
jgi:heterodisulfide reductase subunit A-like polyferredoxin